MRECVRDIYTHALLDVMAEAMDDAVAVVKEVGDNTEDQLSLEVC